MIIIDRQQELADFIGEKTGGTYTPITGRFIGLETAGRIVACVAYTDYNGKSVQMHVACETRFNMDFLVFCFDYAFNRLMINKALTVVDSTNQKSLRFSQKLGFEIAHTIKDAGKEGDLYLLSMVRAQCKLLNK